MPAAQPGTFEREPDALDERITADGSTSWPVQTSRYRLVVARACPWANRSVIVRRLLGLEPVISMGIVGPLHDERSWRFHLDPGNRDPVLGIEYLGEAYRKADPDYAAGITVPAMVDLRTGAVATNGFSQLTLDFSTQWTAHHRPGAPELYPPPLRAEIDEINAGVYTDVNNGVYRCGFASTQAAYDEAYRTLFARLDRLAERLATRRYRSINPSGLVPQGPDPRGWLTRHGREDLGGRPFGDGTPPGLAPPEERVPGLGTTTVHNRAHRSP